MAYRLVVLYKRPGVSPMVIGEMLRRDLAKLVMREDGDQSKIACKNLQLCKCLESRIEGENHAMGNMRR